MMGLQMSAIESGFYMDSEHLESGPQAFRANALPTVPSPQPKFFVYVLLIWVFACLFLRQDLILEGGEVRQGLST